MSTHYKLTKKRLFKYLLVFIVVLISFILDKCSFDRAEIQRQDGSQQGLDGFSSVHFLDVGQGDCTLFETHDGKFALIDASTQDYSSKIVKYLNERSVEKLEFILFTHPHEDHIGGGDEILENFEVGTVYMNSFDGDIEAEYCYETLLEAISDSRKKYDTKLIRPKENDILMLGDIEFKILSDGKDYDNANDSSLCLTAELGKSTFLFTGDAGKTVEYDILDDAHFVDAEVFKSAHHGSTTSNSYAFLNAVNPDIAIISCGKDNSYGHPHDEIIQDLNDRNVEFFRTDRDGDIVLAFDEEHILII